MRDVNERSLKARENIFLQERIANFVVSEKLGRKIIFSSEIIEVFRKSEKLKKCICILRSCGKR